MFGVAANPLRQLGALGFHLFWIVAASGIYVYILFDTSAQGAYASVQAISRESPWSAGLMRSLHRYASDALVLVVGLHVLREWSLGRFGGFRWFTWLSGVPLLWLVLASGIGGYWLVWDALAQFVGTSVTEWFAWLPGFQVSMVRNFLVADTVTDRLFSLLVFLHIGIPLLLLLGMWVHVQRITAPDTAPRRQAGAWMLAALLMLSLLQPAQSQQGADLSQVGQFLALDWFYLFALPVVQRGFPGSLWMAVVAATVLLAALPWLARTMGRTRRTPAAIVDPQNCNGCGRCLDDCPYGAVLLDPRSDGRHHARQAVVQTDLCAGCGICAGACPSATPFRSATAFHAGIEMPFRPLDGLRLEVDRCLESFQVSAPAAGRIVVFCCERSGAAGAAGSSRSSVMLPCAGMLPPSYVDYALRHGAGGVMVAACGPGDCEFRSGADLLGARLDRRREPRLRASVARERVELAHCRDGVELQRALDAFAARLPERAAGGAVPAYKRKAGSR